MTLPNERSNSLRNVRAFLRSLLDPKQTPKVPKSVRRSAYYCLKHFPSDYDIRLAAGKCPEVFGELPISALECVWGEEPKKVK